MSDPFTETIFDEGQLDLPVSQPSYSQSQDLTDLGVGHRLEVVEQPPVSLPALPQMPAPSAPGRASPAQPLMMPTSGFLLDEPTGSKFSMALPIVGAVGLAAVGAAYGGVWGAAAGAATSGAAINLARFATNRTGERAPVHLVFAVVAGAVAAYSGLLAYKSRTTTASVTRNKAGAPQWLKPTR